MLVTFGTRTLLCNVGERLEVTSLHGAVNVGPIGVETDDPVGADLQHARPFGELSRERLGNVTPRAERAVAKRHAQVTLRPRVIFEHQHVTAAVCCARVSRPRTGARETFGRACGTVGRPATT